MKRSERGFTFIDLLITITLMVFIIGYNQTNVFITFKEILAIEIGSLSFQFL